jgi:hypothetical protein
MMTATVLRSPAALERRSVFLMIVEDHLRGPADTVPDPLTGAPIQLSGVWTFFLQIYYLQHVINRDVLGSQPDAG